LVFFLGCVLSSAVRVGVLRVFVCLKVKKLKKKKKNIKNN